MNDINATQQALETMTDHYASAMNIKNSETIEDAKDALDFEMEKIGCEIDWDLGAEVTL